MYTKFIIIIISFLSHFLSQFNINEAILIYAIAPPSNKSYCLEEALILLEDIFNVEKNLAFAPATHHISHDNTTSNEDDGARCPCLTRSCIPICCPHGQAITEDGCEPIDKYRIKNWKDIYFPQIHNTKTLKPQKILHFNFNNLTTKPTHYHNFIHIFQRDPCKSESKNRLHSNDYSGDEFKLLKNGSIIRKKGNPLDLKDYCLSITENNVYSIVTCLDVQKEHIDYQPNYFEPSLNAGMFISLPFLLLTLIVYSIIPELKNIHGFTLRHYIGFLLITYTLIAVVRTCVANDIHFSDGFCTTVAFVVYFSIFSSFFWLNSMCFNIWWSFRGLRGLQGAVKQRERKKYIFYSIYAWVGATFLTAICIIVDFSPQVPSYIRPQFGAKSCGYITEIAAAIYVYPPMGLIVLCNIFFFVSTARKICHYKKETACQLNSTDSHRHDDHERRFNLYLKLFIVMGINWSIELILWILTFAPDHIWYIIDLVNSLQGVVIFLTFVWDDKVKRLLIKRVNINAQTATLSTNSTRSGGYDRSNSASKIAAPLRERNSLNHISNP